MGAFESARTILDAGLFKARPPLPVFQTIVRIAGVVAAIGMLTTARDLFERVTLVFAAVGIGASALFGFGVRAPALSATRIVFHLAAWALGAVVFARRLRAKGV